MNSRRDFLTKLMGVSALSVFPATTQAFFTTPPANADTIIDSVEVIRLTGPYKSIPGVNRQYRSQPIHIYPDLHPAPYKDNPTSVETTGKITRDYIRIKTKSGLTGLYGAVQADPEWCDGVSELVKICNVALSFGGKVFPHGHNVHAALHVVSSQSPEVCPLVEYLFVHMPYKLHFQKNAFSLVTA